MWTSITYGLAFDVVSPTIQEAIDLGLMSQDADGRHAGTDTGRRFLNDLLTLFTPD